MQQYEEATSPPCRSLDNYKKSEYYKYSKQCSVKGIEINLEITIHFCAFLDEQVNDLQMTGFRRQVKWRSAFFVFCRQRWITLGQGC